MGPVVYWSRLLIMKSKVALCRGGTQQGKKRFCLLYSTNRCSDPAPLISDGTVHVFLAHVDALYSWFRLPNLIIAFGFALILAYDHCL